MGQKLTCSTGKPGAPMSVDAARLRAEAVAVTVSETETLPLYMALDRVRSCRESGGNLMAA